MSFLALISLAVILCGSLAPAYIAQNKRRRGVTPRPAQRESVIVTPSEKRMVGDATVIYYAHDDTTIAYAAVMAVEARQQSFVQTTVRYGVAGKRAVRPETVRFDLSLYSPKRPFSGRPTLKFKADGKTFGADKVTMARRVILDMVEWPVSGELPFEDFERIANSGGVKVFLGPLTYELKEVQLGPLRDLLKTVEAQSAEP